MSEMARALAVGSNPGATLAESIGQYWNVHIHDLQVVSHPIGSSEFFQELERYRYNKLRYLPDFVRFDQYRGRRVLEVGCGVGIDLARFAMAGAGAVGIDLADAPIELAKTNLRLKALSGTLRVMNAEDMSFEDGSFDVVYAHGVLPYTANPDHLVAEVHRVLKPGGEALLMSYNRGSWLKWMSKLTGTALEHQDAPVYRMHSESEFRRLLSPFRKLEITLERFPVPTELHRGWKAALYNQLFVKGFELLPGSWVRPLGWHLLARARK